MKPLALIIIILFSSTLLCKQENRLTVYTGNLTSTVDCANSYSENDALFGAAYAEIHPFSVVSINNHIYASPSIHNGSLISNDLHFSVHPVTLPFGEPFIGGAGKVKVSKSESASYQTEQNRYLSYAHIGHSFIFTNDALIAISPWTGAGKTISHVKNNGISADVTDVTANNESLNLLNGVTLQLEYPDNFSATFTYILNYNHTESRGFNNISAMINTFLYKGLGISYRFQYSRDMCNEDILNSIGLSYSGF